MTSRQRVAAALSGQPVDQPATGPLAVHFCAQLLAAIRASDTAELKSVD